LGIKSDLSDDVSDDVSDEASADVRTMTNGRRSRKPLSTFNSYDRWFAKSDLSDDESDEALRRRSNHD
jgi:hypothetical protein